MVTKVEEVAELSLLTDPLHVWRAEGDPGVVAAWIGEAQRIFEGAVS